MRHWRGNPNYIFIGFDYQTLMELQKVVKLTLCQYNFNVLKSMPAAVERFLRNRQTFAMLSVGARWGFPGVLTDHLTTRFVV